LPNLLFSESVGEITMGKGIHCVPFRRKPV
jgi:hypothetical protein